MFGLGVTFKLDFAFVFVNECEGYHSKKLHEGFMYNAVW